MKRKLSRKQRLRGTRPRAIRRHLHKLGKVWLREQPPLDDTVTLTAGYDPVHDMRFWHRSQKLNLSPEESARLSELLVLSQENTR